MIRFVSTISMFGGKPAKGVMDVTRNERYVSSINFGDENLSRQRLPPVTEVPGAEAAAAAAAAAATAGAAAATTIRVLPPIGEGDNNLERSDLFEDSIVTDSLLQMTSLSSKERKEEDSEDGGAVRSSSVEADSIEAERLRRERRVSDEARRLGLAGRTEDMDRVIKELTQAVVNSKNVATITRAMKYNNDRGGGGGGGGRSSFRRGGGALRNSVRALKRSLSRGQGASAMRQLWEKSGMRTNGRKLLHSDSGSSGSGGNGGNGEGEGDGRGGGSSGGGGDTPSQRRRKRKEGGGGNNRLYLPGKKFPGRVMAAAAVRKISNSSSSSSSSSSSTSSAMAESPSSPPSSSPVAWSEEYQQPFR